MKNYCKECQTEVHKKEDKYYCHFCSKNVEPFKPPIQDFTQCLVEFMDGIISLVTFNREVYQIKRDIEDIRNAAKTR